VEKMDLEKVGKLISETRKAKGLTQQELGEKLFVSSKTISKWEQGRGFPSPECLLPLSESLGLSVNEILLGTKIPKEKQEQVANDLTIKHLKQMRSKGKRDIIYGILLCLCFCLLESFFVLGKMNEIIGCITFGLVIIICIIMEWYWKKK